MPEEGMIPRAMQGRVTGRRTHYGWRLQRDAAWASKRKAPITQEGKHRKKDFEVDIKEINPT